MAVVDEKLYVFGGFATRRTEVTDQVQVYDPATGRWERRRPMPAPFTHANAVQVGDTLWFAGGFVGNHPGWATDSVWRYHPPTDTWTPGPPLPAPRAGGVLSLVGENLHYAGGYQPDRFSNSDDHWSLVLGAPGQWTPRAPMPDGRGHLSGAVVDGQVYAVGGAFFHDPVPRDTRLLHRYDPAADRWDRRSSLPMPLSHSEPGTFPMDGRIVVIGGRNNRVSRLKNDSSQILRAMVVYDPADDVWVDLGLLPRPLAGVSAALIGGELIIAGGGLGNGQLPQTSAWAIPFRDAWFARSALPVALEDVSTAVIGRRLFAVGGGSAATLHYALDSARWGPIGELPRRPFPGRGHAAESWDRKWYLFGGLGAEGRTQIFHPKANQWRVGASLPFRATSSTAVTIGDRIFVVGGRDGDLAIAQSAVYDPGADRWDPIAPMPRPRFEAAAGTDGQRLFVFGGRAGEDDAPTADVHIYDPASDRWTASGDREGPPPMPHPRTGTARAVVVDGRFHLIGGEGAEDADLSVDIYDPRSSLWQQGRRMAVPRDGVMPVAAAGRIFVVGGGRGRTRGKSDVFDYYVPPALNPLPEEAIAAVAPQLPGSAPAMAGFSR
ncbi:MAG: Kelch repeat-containing protein [Gemmatimonadales bacterium]